MAKQCDMCFQFKDPLVPVLEGVKAKVCKACNFKLSASIGFLQYHGITLEYQPTLLDTPPTPPERESTLSEQAQSVRKGRQAGKDNS